MSIRSRFILRNICFVLFLLTSTENIAQDDTNITDRNRDEIGPPDVLVLVGTIREELDLIRIEMGKPESRPSNFLITGAEPREVFFQALTLYRKVDRILFEHLHESEPLSIIPEDKIPQPVDVYDILLKALIHLRKVKLYLEIPEQIVVPARDDIKEPSDVFSALLKANKESNLLLERRFSPSDVFHQVILATSYAESLLTQYPSAKTIPDAPPMERGKRPRDVYQRLVKCFELIRQSADSLGFRILEMETDNDNEITPSDVYDIASLVVSELIYIHSGQGNLESPRQIYYPGLKIPSQVFQRVGILEQQLLSLRELVKANPEALNIQ